MSFFNLTYFYSNSCQCKNGYSGTFCEISCFNTFCSNGGVCDVVDGQPTCKCPAQWTGSYCEVDVDECQIPGSCNDMDQCYNYEGGFACNCYSSSQGLFYETTFS